MATADESAARRHWRQLGSAVAGKVGQPSWLSPETGPSSLCFRRRRALAGQAEVTGWKPSPTLGEQARPPIAARYWATLETSSSRQTHLPLDTWFMLAPVAAPNSIQLNVPIDENFIPEMEDWIKNLPRFFGDSRCVAQIRFAVVEGTKPRAVGCQRPEEKCVPSPPPRSTG